MHLLFKKSEILSTNDGILFKRPEWNHIVCTCLRLEEIHRSVQCYRLAYPNDHPILYVIGQDHDTHLMYEEAIPEEFYPILYTEYFPIPHLQA